MSVVIASELVNKVSEAFNFSVDKLPLSGPDNLKTDWYGLFRSDSGETVGNGSVTDRYTPHQTDDVLALVEAAAAAFDGEIDVQCHFREGHYVSVEPTKENRISIFGTADNIFPRIVIRAGYDGKAFNAAMGYYRDLCMNMHIMRQVNGTSVSIRHTSGLRSKMDELIQTFGVLKESWGTLASVIGELESRTVRMADFLNTVYGEPDESSKRAVTVHRHRTEDIFRRLQNERFRSGRPLFDEEYTVSVWEAFNVVQGYVQHDATRKSTTNANTFLSRAILSMNDPAVKRAEEYALSLLSV